MLEAGLALTPGPFVAAAVAGPTSHLVMRIGARPVLVAGGLLWGAAVFWFVARVGITPDFVGEWLPGILLLGLGAGTLLPNLTAAAVASAPGAGYATATGLNSVARQIGAALGVALVVAILGTPSPAEAAAAFDRAWTFGAACFIVAGLGCFARRAPGGSRAAVAGVRSSRRAGRRAGVHRAPPPPPTARRVMSTDPASSLPPRAETAAEFLAKVPMFAALECSSATRWRNARAP